MTIVEADGTVSVISGTIRIRKNIGSFNTTGFAVIQEWIMSPGWVVYWQAKNDFNDAPGFKKACGINNPNGEDHVIGPNDPTDLGFEGGANRLIRFRGGLTKGGSVTSVGDLTSGGGNVVPGVNEWWDYKLEFLDSDGKCRLYFRPSDNPGALVPTSSSWSANNSPFGTDMYKPSEGTGWDTVPFYFYAQAYGETDMFIDEVYITDDGTFTPPAPSGLTKVNLTSSPPNTVNMSFSWTNNGDDGSQTGFYLYNSIDGSDFSLAVVINEPLSSFYSFDGAINKIYQFKIQSYVTVGSGIITSDFSNTISFDTSNIPQDIQPSVTGGLIDVKAGDAQNRALNRRRR